MSDSKVDAAVAAGHVPDNVSVVFLKESRDSQAIAGIIFVTVITSVIVLGRIASRSFLVRRLGVDDGLAFLSFLLFIVFVGLCIHLINLGSGRHYEYIQLVLTLPEVEDTEVLDFVAHIIYTTALILCRVSGLAFYHRICAQHHKLLLSIYIVGAVLIAGYFPQLFLIVFHCAPVTGLWPYDWQPGAERYKCLQWGLVYSVNSSVSLLCDILLFGIPIVMLRILEMPRKRKIQLACILLPGILVISISVTRLILVIKGQWEPDMSWTYNPMLGAEVSEIGATLVALSIPGVKPLFDRFILRKKSVTGSGSGDKYGSAKASQNHNRASWGTPLRSIRLHSDSQFHGKEARSDGDNVSNDSADGILVRVDIRVQEDQKSSREDTPSHTVHM